MQFQPDGRNRAASTPIFQLSSETGYDPITDSFRITDRVDGRITATTDIFHIPNSVDALQRNNLPYIHTFTQTVILPIGGILDELLGEGESITRIIKYSFSRIVVANLELVAQTVPFKSADESRPVSIKAVFETSEGRPLYVRGYQLENSPIRHLVEDQSKFELFTPLWSDLFRFPKKIGDPYLTPFCLASSHALERLRENQSGLFVRTVLDSVIQSGFNVMEDLPGTASAVYISKWSDVKLPNLGDVPTFQNAGTIEITPSFDRTYTSPESNLQLLPASFEFRLQDGRPVSSGKMLLAYANIWQDHYGYESMFYPGAS